MVVEILPLPVPQKHIKHDDVRCSLKYAHLIKSKGTLTWDRYMCYPYVYRLYGFNFLGLHLRSLVLVGCVYDSHTEHFTLNTCIVGESLDDGQESQ